MTEVLFYHLERQPLERVLPVLLERSLERRWRCAVQATSRERVEALDTHLWVYRDDSFLPHGVASEPEAARQPVLLTEDEDNPNGATVRFLVDGARLSDYAPYERVVDLFDGNDDEQVAAARERWKIVKGLGLSATYWQQDEDGRWQKKA